MRAAISRGVSRVPAARPAVRCPAPRVQIARARSVEVRFFKFGGNNNASQQGSSLPQQRDDYDADDVEHYFNYMGCLANEGTYDRMEALQGLGLAPVDVILLLASQENDTPKIVELLAAGANVTVKDHNGKTPLELATKDEVIRLLKDKAGTPVASA